MAESRSLVPVKLEAAGDAHIGGRAHNEDAILLRPDLNLYMVADGAGGQNAGNVASSLATTAIAHFFEQTAPALDNKPEFDALGLATAARQLSAAVQDANREILEIARSSDRHKGMGTTVAAALFAAPHRAVHIAYVGDSRIYRLRDGRIELLTHDHSLANDVLEMRPDIEDARIKKLPQNVITRALGMAKELRVSVRTHEIAHGDRYLICSDGLSDVVDRPQLAEALGLDAAPEERVKLLVEMAIEGRVQDNVAVVVVDISFGSQASSQVRPVRKLTPTSMARVEAPPAVRQPPSQHRVTEESVPEIVLYEGAEDRESSPMIHVVPMASATDLLAEEMGRVIGPKGARPARRRDSPAPPRGSAEDKEARNTVMYSANMERGGAAAETGFKRGYSVPRRNKQDVSEIVDEESRTGDTRQPPGPTLDGVMKERAASIPPPADDDDDLDDPPTAVHDRASQPGPPPLPDKPARRKKTTTKAKAKAEPKPKKALPGKASAAGKQLPKPAARELLDTSDFEHEDIVKCHGCSSVISRDSEKCLYCGAPTGFLVRPKK